MERRIKKSDIDKEKRQREKDRKRKREIPSRNHREKQNKSERKTNREIQKERKRHCQIKMRESIEGGSARVFYKILANSQLLSSLGLIKY